jgi:hypothetical protein
MLAPILQASGAGPVRWECLALANVLTLKHAWRGNVNYLLLQVWEISLLPVLNYDTPGAATPF